jgi:hypothetical protein
LRLIRKSKMINRNLYKRLERLEARSLAASVPEENRIVFVNGGSLRPACVIGPDGRFVWWRPPAGYKVGELIEDSETRPGLYGVPARILVGFADDEGGAGPTTLRGPDKRLVWLKPPKGCKEDEPIEDSAGDPETTA